MSTGRLGAGDTAIQPTIFDAKADLLTATAADTPARLAVGTNGQYLKADSTASTGLSWATLPSSGKVLQVVSTTYSTSTSVSSDTTWTDSGLTLNITPSSASSKVLILLTAYCRKNGADSDAAIDLRLVRAGTTIYTLTRNLANDSTNFQMSTISMSYLDSPATTSATTYKLQFKGHTATTVFVQYNSNPSSLVLAEIGA